MEWLDSIVGALGGGLITILGSVVYFKPKLRAAKAEASKAETEANGLAYAGLVERINSLEDMYKKQGDILDSEREDRLAKVKENYELKTRVAQLEAENKAITARLESLSKEVEAYKTLVKGAK